MKKIIIVVAVVALIGLLIVLQKFGLSNNVINIKTNESTGSSNNSSASESTNPNQVNPTAGGAKSKVYKDGSYTGKVTDAFYGNYQVKAVISGGKITDVQFLLYPNDREHSSEINLQSNPILKQEAISNQSASVDIVTGATQSSIAFQQSLQSALDQAL